MDFWIVKFSVRILEYETYILICIFSGCTVEGIDKCSVDIGCFLLKVIVNCCL